MKRVLFSFISAAALASSIAAPANAQSALVDRANITAVCATSVASCNALVAQVIASLKAAGLTDAQLGTELGNVAGSVAQAAQDNPALRQELASTISDIATDAPTQEQAQAISLAAAVISRGGGGGGFTNPVGGSPG